MEFLNFINSADVNEGAQEMNRISDAVAGIGVLVKSASGIIVFAFLIQSMYFTGDYDLGLLNGTLAFFGLCLFIGLTAIIPLGSTLAPLLFEWGWHDIPLWEFTTAAWIVTGISMFANVLFFVGIGLSRNSAATYLKGSQAGTSSRAIK